MAIAVFVAQYKLATGVLGRPLIEPELANDVGVGVFLDFLITTR